MTGQYELGYKSLFAHPELVHERLAEFAQMDWIAGASVMQYERVNPVFVSERFSERRDHLV